MPLSLPEGDLGGFLCRFLPRNPEAGQQGSLPAGSSPKKTPVRAFAACNGELGRSGGSARLSATISIILAGPPEIVRPELVRLEVRAKEHPGPALLPTKMAVTSGNRNYGATPPGVKIGQLSNGTGGVGYGILGGRRGPQ